MGDIRAALVSLWLTSRAISRSRERTRCEPGPFFRKSVTIMDQFSARANPLARMVPNKLFITKNTVKTHVKRIYHKLGIHSRQELADLIEEFEGTL